jgi:hypothetical protein
MTEILTAEGLAQRWHCSESRIRNAPSDQLPPALRLPGSRLVRYRLCDVIAWETAHVAGKTTETRHETPTPPARKRGPGRPRKTRGNR